MIFPDEELRAAREGFLRAAAEFAFGKGKRAREAASLVDRALLVPDEERGALLARAVRVGLASQARTPGGARRLTPDGAEAIARIQRMLGGG